MVHTWLSCSARAGIAVNSRDPLRDYTVVLSFVDFISSDRCILSQHAAIFYPNLSSLSYQIPSHNFASISSLEVTCFSTLEDPHSNLGTRFFLRGEVCDTPGVYFGLCRKNYPNLGCSVKISISRSHVSDYPDYLSTFHQVWNYSFSRTAKFGAVKTFILGVNVISIFNLDL
jgi:hypothetical protein